MSSGAFFVRPVTGSPATSEGFITLEWPVEGTTTPTVVSDLAWSLAPLHAVPPQAADLVHLAAGAYMADRSTPRGVRFQPRPQAEDRRPRPGPVGPGRAPGCRRAPRLADRRHLGRIRDTSTRHRFPRVQCRRASLTAR